jgi:hypothetical protein
MDIETEIIALEQQIRELQALLLSMIRDNDLYAEDVKTLIRRLES